MEKNLLVTENRQQIHRYKNCFWNYTDAPYLASQQTYHTAHTKCTVPLMPKRHVATQVFKRRAQPSLPIRPPLPLE